MNKLQLVQRLQSKVAATGINILSTIGNTGEAKRLVDEIDEAYERIQSKHLDWDFLRQSFSLAVSSAANNYATSLISANFSEWAKQTYLKCYLTATGVADETFLSYVPWNQFFNLYRYNAISTATGRPLYWAIEPGNKALHVYPTPSDNYTITGEYWRTPATMALDTDEPLFSKHHMAIVYEAMLFSGAYLSDGALYDFANNELSTLMRYMERDYRLPTKDFAWNTLA